MIVISKGGDSMENLIRILMALLVGQYAE